MTAKTEAKRRAQIHKIINLCLDINGIQETNQRCTGSRPTAFFRFSGHVGMMDIDVSPHGYCAREHKENWNFSVCEEDDTEILRCIRDIKEIKAGMQHEEME